jgi:hypothetical protein
MFTNLLIALVVHDEEPIEDSCIDGVSHGRNLPVFDGFDGPFRTLRFLRTITCHMFSPAGPAPAILICKGRFGTCALVMLSAAIGALL